MNNFNLPPGVWRVESYCSGTLRVHDGKDQKYNYDWGTSYGLVGPSIHIEWPPPTVPGRERMREVVAEKLAKLLNGETIEASFKRTGEDTAIIDGIPISAEGPSIDINPPNCFWQQDPSETARNARARLMDKITF